ncbi:STAS domain-containing protein [Nonomuraea sp. NN258]|uniref:STAS domain-containing protein n=1 Tax=Nonomuraea antri TaxID=2730852 RepID=UPI001567CB34|nr:STAS domain-containing protein [Nonomuraea antri]NRQ37637.1 STAS domain-containing protein [Nonomuraea antri]
MHDALELTATREGDIVVLRPVGDLSWSTAALLGTWLNEYVRQPAPVTLVDLSQISALDSSGLSLLVSIHVRLSEAGTVAAFAAPSPSPARMLEITGLAGRLPLYDTVQAARLATGPGPRLALE